MSGFMDMLKVQRWDDHRYYHHSLVNQSLHLLSATSFLFAYAMLFWNPAAAALVAQGLGSDAGICDLDDTLRFMRETPLRSS